MTDADLFGDPADTREAIMKATFEALCEHGYADLTIQRIGDEFPKSKSLIYHHYDGKDDLLLDFLAFMLRHFETSVTLEDREDAAVQLRAVLERMLPETVPDDHREFVSAMVELRAQAAHDPAYRDHFTKSTQSFREHLAAIIERGVEQGVFRDVDPDQAAAFLLTMIDGAMFQRATADVEERMPAVREELERYIETRLLADHAAAE